MTNLRENGDESLTDQISRITSFRTHNSVMSNLTNNKLVGLSIRADPNSALSIQNERKACDLVEKIDGPRYTKRMNILGKDLHKDVDMNKAFRKSLLN